MAAAAGQLASWRPRRDASAEPPKAGQCAYQGDLTCCSASSQAALQAGGRRAARVGVAAEPADAVGPWQALTRSAALAGSASAKRGATKRLLAHNGRPGTATSLFPGCRRGEPGGILGGARQRETARDTNSRDRRSTFRELLLLYPPPPPSEKSSKSKEERKNYSWKVVGTGAH